MLRRVLDAILGRKTGGSASPPSELDAAEVMEMLHGHARPCALLRRAEEAGRSKLGGLPDVPAEFEWPTWNGAPLQFLCQIDLEALRKAWPADWLPQAGLLSFFYDAEQSTWGFDPRDRGSWQVAYFPPDARLAPAGLPQVGEAVELLPELFVRVEPSVSLPDPERLELASARIPDEVWDYLDEQQDGVSPLHQMGGFPSPIQADAMELECQLASNGVYVGDAKGYRSEQVKALAPGSVEWRLLLQLDSDDDAGMMWGDAGRLYFWVREAEAAGGDFSNVWMVLQCS